MEESKKPNKVWKFLTSMKFAIILLLILAAACALASLITQGQSYEYYASAYSEKTAALIIAAGLDDAYHSWWFLLISGFLCLNLIFCNLVRLPQLIKRTKAAASPDAAQMRASSLVLEGITDPEQVFKKLGMPLVKEPADKKRFYSVKNRIGLWGAWICHLGILLLIVGFGLGQMTYQESVVYGVPGQTRLIPDTNLALTIDDFRIGLREDDTVEQYTADITVQDLSAPDGASESAEISVNHPGRLFGRSFYQNSTGWAAKVTVKKGGELLQEEVLCAGEYTAVKGLEDLVVFFNAFYPDYVLVPGSGPQTLSGKLNNPAYLYTLYFQEEILGMNVLMPDEAITVSDYTITFSEPQNYTVIQVKKDSFSELAFAGGVLVMLGLMIAFYFQMVQVYAEEQPDGTWKVYGHCPKGGVLFKEKFMKLQEKDTEKKDPLEEAGTLKEDEAPAETESLKEEESLTEAGSLKEDEVPAEAGIRKDDNHASD